MTVAVCVPMRDRPDHEFAESLVTLDHGEHQVDVYTEYARPVVEARNALTSQALRDPDVSHLLWIDDDTTFPADALLRLLKHGKPVVSGLYFLRRPPFAPAVAKLLSPAWHAPFGAMGSVYEDDLPGQGLFECDAVGAGLLLVRRDVFEKIGRSWWSLAEPYEQAEDYSFCARVRHYGFPIFVDCGLEAGHAGRIVIRRREARALRVEKTGIWRP